MRSFGVKNVDFGGMSSPSFAVRRISSMLVGRISTPATTSPAGDQIDHVLDAVLVGDVDVGIAQGVLEQRAVEGADALERRRLRRQPRAGAVRVHEAQRASFDDLARERRIDRAGGGQVEALAQDRHERVDVDAAIEPVDGIDAELALDEFAHVGEGEIPRAGPVGRPSLVAVRAADRVAMVAVGDQHRVRPDRGSDRCDPSGIGDALDRVDHAVVVGAGAHEFGRLEQQVGETSASATDPRRGRGWPPWPG